MTTKNTNSLENKQKYNDNPLVVQSKNTTRTYYLNLNITPKEVLASPLLETRGRLTCKEHQTSVSTLKLSEGN